MFREQSEGETAAARSRRFRERSLPCTALVTITGTSGRRLSHAVPEASVVWAGGDRHRPFSELVVISGGAGALGRCICTRLANCGATVVSVDVADDGEDQDGQDQGPAGPGAQAGESGASGRTSVKAATSTRPWRRSGNASAATRPRCAVTPASWPATRYWTTL